MCGTAQSVFDFPTETGFLSNRQSPPCARTGGAQAPAPRSRAPLRDLHMPGPINGKLAAAAAPLQRERRGALRLTPALGTVLLDTLGLEASIEWHLHRCLKVTGIPYELAVNNAAGFDLSEDYAATIFDIYSEALNNVAQHAKADHVAVALTITPLKVTLVVRDNGLGLEEGAAAKGGGIAAMRARAQNHHGLCELTGARNAGTTVKVSLPIRRAA